jgi:hypothetical protein
MPLDHDRQAVSPDPAAGLSNTLWLRAARGKAAGVSPGVLLAWQAAVLVNNSRQAGGALAVGVFSALLANQETFTQGMRTNPAARRRGSTSRRPRRACC